MKRRQLILVGLFTVLSVGMLVACGNESEKRTDSTMTVSAEEDRVESAQAEMTSDGSDVIIIENGSDLPVSLPALKGSMLDGTSFDDDNYWGTVDVTLLYVWKPSEADVDKLKNLQSVKDDCGDKMQILGVIPDDENEINKAKELMDQANVSFDNYIADENRHRPRKIS